MRLFAAWRNGIRASQLRAFHKSLERGGGMGRPRLRFCVCRFESCRRNQEVV